MAAEMDEPNGFYNMLEKRDAKDTGGRWKKQSGRWGQRYNFPNNQGQSQNQGKFQKNISVIYSSYPHILIPYPPTFTPHHHQIKHVLSI